ncbi:MAG: penicillin-insensitive murein endopeptidase, partial [Myxococcota bacterium]
SGHASHQSGLDVDLWYTYPAQAARRALTRKEREQLPAHAIVDLKTKKATEHFTPRITAILKLTARDRRVARIFVHPIIKQTLCTNVRGKRAWLRKLRPWYGHHDHFHVRLHCPDDSPDCQSQSSVGNGDGCDELDWWLSEDKQAARAKGRKSYRKRIRSVPRLPEQCSGLLDAPTR